MTHRYLLVNEHWLEIFVHYYSDKVELLSFCRCHDVIARRW